MGRLIKNKKEIGISKQRKQLLAIVEAGIKSVMPGKILPKILRYDAKRKILKVNNTKFKIKGRIFVVGGGKAGGLMAESIEKIIGAGNIEAGVINSVGSGYAVKKIKVNKASHPVPDGRGMQGVKMMLELREKYMIDENDMVLCLISGGGSALLPYPKRGIKLADKQKVTKLLLKSGAEVHEMNMVRKHLSAIKGGQLAEFFRPARIASLIISDVVGNDLDTIASGLTAADSSSWRGAYQILKKYKLTGKVPNRVMRLIDKGRQGQLAENPKKLPGVNNFIIADNLRALEAMKRKARELKLKSRIVSDGVVGETSRVARKIAREIKSGKLGSGVMILGGETTVSLPANHGQGGRNQHWCALSLGEMKNFKGKWALASVGSDGVDFTKLAAGAIVDRQTLWLIKKKKINMQKYIERFDSYTLFKKSGKSLIRMNNTGTNVGDLMVYVIG